VGVIKDPEGLSFGKLKEILLKYQCLGPACVFRPATEGIHTRH